jgi:hypothetical protein
MFSLFPLRQVCQINLGAMYQNGEKYQIAQNVPKGHIIYQVSEK